MSDQKGILQNVIVRNILGFILGMFVGSVINSLLISLNGTVIPLPEGIDPQDIESLKANIDRFSVANCMVPILAHAIGALAGAFVASKICLSHQKIFSLVIGGLFMLGGIAMVVMLPQTPMWVIVVDLILYIPAALLGWKLAGSKA